MNFTDESRPLRKGAGLLRRAAILATIAAVTAGSAGAGSGGSASRPVRIAFSAGIFGSIDRVDAQAAVVAWGEAILTGSGVVVDPSPLIADSREEIVDALTTGTVDGLVMESVLYFSLPPGLVDDRYIFANVRTNGDTDVYVILTRRDSGLNTLDDLRGKSMIRLSNNRGSLALPWLETLLAEQALPPAAEFFKPISDSEKLPTVVLPVFFGKHAACMVTRSGFEDMVELNPQVGERMQIIAESPTVVPSFFCFRADYDQKWQPHVERAVVTLHETSAGRQALMAFQCDQIVRRPQSILNNSRKIYEAWIALQHPRSLSAGQSSGARGRGVSER